MNTRKNLIQWTVPFHKLDDMDIVKYVEKQVKKTGRTKARILRDLMREGMYSQERKQR